VVSSKKGGSGEKRVLGKSPVPKRILMRENEKKTTIAKKKREGKMLEQLIWHSLSNKKKREARDQSTLGEKQAGRGGFWGDFGGKESLGRKGERDLWNSYTERGGEKKPGGGETPIVKGNMKYFVGVNLEGGVDQ